MSHNGMVQRPDILFCCMSFLAKRKIDAIYTFPNNGTLTTGNLHKAAAAVAAVAVAARESQQPPRDACSLV